MRILHICGYYTGSKVHKELFERLDKRDVEQTIYSALQTSNPTVGANIFEAKNTSFICSPILHLWHRALFLTKTRRILKDVERRCDVRNFDLIDATTSYTDGAVAYRLHKKYGTPYVITVRNTDLNDFMKFPQWWPIHRKTLKAASKIIFITPAMKEKFIAHSSLRGLEQEIEAKSVIQPNGINAYWLNHLDVTRRDNHSIFYVGKFDNNKNVLRLIEAVQSLRTEIPDAQLNLVGGDGAQHEDVLAKVAGNPEWLNYHGKIFDKDQLQSLYQQNAVFAMPSHHETFGLVYVEAMSQGLSTLCTKGEGIDGVFKKKIGEFVDSHSVESIREALRKLLNNNEEYELLSVEELMAFDWDVIAERYMSLFENV
ncbi:MAG: glycosyltransferase family 4 protein [Bacteroidales bacterium]|nr:glycosyltransferase family 4 protein [Bacteroidales bacterium]